MHQNFNVKYHKMLSGCFPSRSNSVHSSRKQHERSTVWYIGLADDSLQLLKEEKVDGAVYSIYVKKVNYHTSLSEESDANNSFGSKCANSTFYTDLPDDALYKAQLQWRLEEVRVIRYGTVQRLVEALASDTGDLDSSYVNTFLETYRTFATVSDVMNHLLSWYVTCRRDPSLPLHKKNGRERCLRSVIMTWFEVYPDDFFEPPNYDTLYQLHLFAEQFFTGSDLARRCAERIATFRTCHEQTADVHVDDVSVEFKGSCQSLDDPFCHESTSDGHLLLKTVSSKVFAEQLTCKDAELFRKVVPHQCLGSLWSRRHEHAAQVASVYATVKQFNAVSRRVIATVVQPSNSSVAENADVIEKWINIAQELRRLKNFSSLKAIVAGLQSSSVHRLRKTWSLVSRTRLMMFNELAHIFSDDDNQRRSREVLNREGTAKHAELNTLNALGVDRHLPESSCLPFAWSRRSTLPLESSESMSVQGTVPYLGTFLTDLMMIDSALKDTAEENDQLINFDKHRKEFEILTKIRLLQSAAALYDIEPDADFWHKFCSIPFYSDNESYELSCKIESESSVSQHTPGRRHHDHSLGYFSVHRRSFETHSLASFGCWPMSESPDTMSLHSLQDSLSPRHRSRTRPRPLLRDYSSVGSLPGKLGSTSSPMPSSSESVVARVYLCTSDCHVTNQYKSIILSNRDHTQTVISNTLLKYNAAGSPSEFSLFQLLPDRSELSLPEDVNIFYAVDLRGSALIELVVRRKT